MRPLVLVISLLVFQLAPAHAGLARARTVYAPRPEYPGYGSGHEPGGSGVFVLHVNKKTAQ
jgi:hypothetical protein